MVFWIVLVFLLAVPAAEAGPQVIVDFSARPTSGSAPLTVSFKDLSAGHPAGWAWYFGDETYTAPWTLENPRSAWVGRDAFASAATPDGSIVLMGGGVGYNPDFYLLNDAWRSTDYGKTWTRVNASCEWSPRADFTAVAMPDNSIVLMGGRDTLYRNDTWRSRTHGATWTRMTSQAAWPSRSRFSTVALPDGSIVLTGGWFNNVSWAYNDTWRSTDYGATWTRMNASSGWPWRLLHTSVAMPDGSIIVMGGTTPEIPHITLNDTWRSTDLGATWTLMNASSGWAARQGLSGVAMPDNSIVITGGWRGGGVGYNDTWRSTDYGRTWTLVNASSGWEKRSSQEYVAMPDSSIVMIGGIIGLDQKNDTWRFAPAGSTLQNPQHTYTRTGWYPVALQAYNDGMYNSTRKKTGYIVVNWPFTRSSTSGGFGLPTLIPVR